MEVDIEDRFIAVNDRVCEILGYTREELLQLTVHDLTAPEDRPRSDALNADLKRGDLESFDYEKRYLAATVHACGFTSRWRRCATRRAASFAIGTIEDISARREAEAQLRLQSAALDAAANGIAITDIAGVVLWANQAFGRMTGYDLTEVLGQNTRMLKSGMQDEAFYRRMWSTIRQGKVWQGELSNRRKDGSLYHEEMTIAPVCDAAGSVTHFIAVKQDISVRKQDEEELIAAKVSAEQAKTIAEEATQARDRFLAVLSHELRTPLTPVLATVSLLENEALLDPRVGEGHAMIRRNVELEARLIDDLLDVTRIARGKVELNRQPVESVRPSCNGRSTSVCPTSRPASRTSAWISETGALLLGRGDAARLQQVFWNVLKNAVKFTPPGELRRRALLAGPVTVSRRK